jgi:hypothetical protein
MRVCVFGSREGVAPGPVAAFVLGLPDDALVVTGGARGVDTWAALVADEVCRCPSPSCRHVGGDPAFRNLQTRIFPADWRRHGRGAGPIRNAQMVRFADQGQGFRCAGRSPGTDDCAAQFRRAGKPVRVDIAP